MFETKKILLYLLILYVVIDIIRKFNNPLKEFLNSFINQKIKNITNNSDTNNQNEISENKDINNYENNDTNNERIKNKVENSDREKNRNSKKKKRRHRKDSVSQLDELIQMSDMDDDDLEFINEDDNEDDNNNELSYANSSQKQSLSQQNNPQALEKIQETSEEMYDDNYLEKTLIYFIIAINDDIVGRIIIKLFDEEVPITSKNFRELSYSSPIVGDTSPAYEGTKFHRTIKDLMIQGGRMKHKDVSIYGEKFEDENFDIKHSEAGLISMVNEGPDTNSSQFFILTKPAPHLDGKNVVFGKVIDGMDIVKIIEESPTKDDIPIDNIRIYESGLLGPINI